MGRFSLLLAVVFLFVEQLASVSLYASAASAQWPPASIGSNLPSLYGLAPRAFFYSACGVSPDNTARWCDVFAGIGPSRQETNGMYEAEQIQYPFPPGTPLQRICYLKITPPGCPSSRSGGAMVMLTSAALSTTYALIYGGSDANAAPLSDMYIYHYERETWLPVTPPADFAQIPPTLILLSMVTTGGENFTVFFGASSTLGLSNVVFEGSVDLKTMSLTQFRTVSTTAENITIGIPGGRVGACCVAHASNQETMCFGGVDGVRMLDDTWIYNHEAGQWTLVSNDASSFNPSARFAAMCSFLPQGNAALLYGGFKDGSRTPVPDSTVYAFSFLTRAWSVFGDTTSSANVPTRGGGALFVTNFGLNIEIVGGQGSNGVLGDRWTIPVLSSNNNTTVATLGLGVPVNIEDDYLVPEPREYHCSVQIGAGFLIAFGKGSMLYNNAFYCANLTEGDKRECEWAEVSTAKSVVVPSPRFSLSACVKGTVVYFFGGFTSLDESLMSNELWTLTLDFLPGGVVTGVWNLVVASSSSLASLTPARARHQCVLIQSNLIIVAGVVGSSTSISGSVAAFDLQAQVWLSLPVMPSLVPRAAFGLHYNGSHAFLVGGVSTTDRGTEVLNDVVALFEDSNNQGNLISMPIPLDYPVLRSDAAVAGSGNNIIVCGGGLYESSQLTLGAPVPIQCAAIAIGNSMGYVQFYPMSRTNSYLRVVEAGGIGASASFVGDHYIFFGGSITQDQVERQDTYYDLTETFVFRPFLCTSEQITAAGANILPCFRCGPGSRNPTAAEYAANGTCVFAPPGSYVPLDDEVVLPCPPGRASNILGASQEDACELCAEGKFAALPGSTHCLPCPPNRRCPLGCSVPESTEEANATVYQVQPQVMPDGETPPLIFTTAAAVVGFLLLVLSGLSYLAHRARRMRREYFFNDFAIASMREVYERYKRSHFGLDGPRLRAFLKDLGATQLPSDFVSRVLAENDETGAGHVTFSSLQEVVIAFIERGLLAPFPGTGQDLNPGKALSALHRRLARFSFKDLDSYDTEHALGVEGEAIRIHSTLSGGVTRLVFNILAVGVALALVGQFLYTNITETRATTPSVNYDNPLQTSALTLQVTAMGGVLSAKDCIVVPSPPPPLYLNGSSSGAMPCSQGTGLVSMSDGIHFIANFTQTCTYHPIEASCTITLTCLDCSFDFGQTVTVGVKFDPDTYAQALRVDVAVDTGILENGASMGGLSSLTGKDETSSKAGELSSSGILITPSSQSEVFRGFPASVFSFPILPTSFEEVDNIVTQNGLSNTGYHVLLGGGTLGHTIDSAQITQYFGVPVTVAFVVDSNVLSVKRLPKATVLDFLSQLLGSITGMGGILVTLMQAYDARFISKRHEKLRAELEEQVLSGDGHLSGANNKGRANSAVFHNDGDGATLRRLGGEDDEKSAAGMRAGRRSVLDEELIPVNSSH